MKLVWLEVDGYRRFGSKNRLKIDSKLVALVGPNEAGKTSLLQLITHLQHDSPFEESELTRYYEPDDSILEGAFFLDDEDRAEIADLPGGSEVNWLHVFKSKGEGRLYDVVPSVHRPTKPRMRLADAFERAEHHKIVRLMVDEHDEELPWSLEELASGLRNDDDDLPESLIGKLQEVSEFFAEWVPDKAPKYIQEMAATINSVIAHEKAPSPLDMAIERLERRIPSILLFDSESRDLHSSYDLEVLDKRAPRALQNLADAAKLDLSELSAASSNDNQALITTLETQANSRLSTAFESVWNQSGIRIQFRVDADTLHIQVRDEADHFSGLDERSDGLRQFVALMAFCHQRNVSNPLLLLDELETHLHYDAQADLINMLARQPLARQVIYTTHSIGCLPDELGAGIRMIKPDPQEPLSTIQNRFWADGGAGFSPVLFGMGATTLAYFAVRTALLVEGPSDMILLPKILRDAGRRDYVGFQVVTGLSTANRQQIPALAAHGATVAYLVDNDDGGSELRRWLVRRGVANESIVSIAPPKTSCAAIEDLIDRKVLASAVNNHLRKFSGVTAGIKKKDIANTKRYAAIASWCTGNGHKPPGKVNLAYAILDVVSSDPDTRMLDASRVDIARRLLENVEAILAN